MLIWIESYEVIESCFTQGA